MYKSYTAPDFRKLLKLPDDYHVDGFMDYGTSLSRTYPFEQFENSLKKFGVDYQISKLDSELLAPISEIKIGDKIFWFTNAYGGAELSEFLHTACILGSKKNIHLGCCGGLVEGGFTRDIIIPEYSYGRESSAKYYQPDSNDKYYSDKTLSDKLTNELSSGHKIFRGPIITCQAMLIQSSEDHERWSKDGYYGVEMEASTVFAVSKYFNVPAAAILYISDNLIKGETIMDDNHINDRELRRQTSQEIFDVVVKELCFS